jgi:hypothetical protein
VVGAEMTLEMRLRISEFGPKTDDKMMRIAFKRRRFML